MFEIVIPVKDHHFLQVSHIGQQFIQNRKIIVQFDHLFSNDFVLVAFNLIFIYIYVLVFKLL
jgi:hypothetical protein